MDELISRQQAIDAIEEYFARIGKLKRRGLNNGEKAIALDTVGAIKSLPSAQPKRGKWIQISKSLDCVKGYWVTCSACDRRLFGGGKFCPMCGADMREVTE